MRFLSFIGIKSANGSLVTIENFLIALSLPGTLVSVMEVVPVCFRQHCVDKVCAYFVLVAVAAHCGRY